MKVVLYVRVSSEEQAQKDLSIPAQLSCLHAVVTKQGHTVVRVFEDAGYSAFIDARSRPDFMKLVRYCVAHKPDAVLVWKYDRFARNVDDSRLYKTLLLKAGVKVISINEPIEDNPSGFLLERMLEIFAEFAPRTMGRDVARGYKEKAARGTRTTGKAPFGYQLEHTRSDGRVSSRLVPGPDDQVALVRRIFGMAVEGMGAKLIAKQLNLSAVPGPRGQLWFAVAILRMLRNPLYVGRICYGRVLTVGYIHQTQPTPPILPADHTAIISTETWELVQKGLLNRSKRTITGKYRKGRYLLTGFLKCGVCGANCYGSYTSHKKGRSFYYSCVARKTSSVCTSSYYSQTALNTHVKASLLASLTSDNLDSLRTALKTQHQKLVATLSPSDVDSNRIAINTRIKRLYDALEHGMDPVECHARIKTLKMQLGTLETQANNQATRERLDTALGRALAILDMLSTNLADAVDAFPDEAARHLLMGFVESIVVHPDRGLTINHCFNVDSPCHVTPEKGNRSLLLRVLPLPPRGAAPAGGPRALGTVAF